MVTETKVSKDTTYICIQVSESPTNANKPNVLPPQNKLLEELNNTSSDNNPGTPGTKPS